MTETMCRKWLITINNPLEHGFSREKIIEILKLFKPSYFCLCDEVGEQGTPHTHIFIYSLSPIRFSTLRKRFNDKCHLDKVRGSCEECRNYLLKQHTEKNEKKSHTSIEGSFFEWGEMPEEKDNNINSLIIEELLLGKQVGEIVVHNPKLIYRVKQLEALKESLLEKNYAGRLREDLKVIYIFSKHEITQFIYEKHDVKDICRITEYAKPMKFDSYKGHKVLVLEDFKGDIEIEKILYMSEKFPYYLEARYYNRLCCYSFLYLISNRSPKHQYVGVQKANSKKYNKWIQYLKILEISESDEIIEHDREEYLI